MATLRNTVFYEVLRRVRDRIRSVTIAGGGYADLRTLTSIEGEHTAGRTSSIEIVVAPDSARFAQVYANSVMDGTVEFSVSIWTAFEVPTATGSMPANQVLDYLLRDVWSALFGDGEGQLDGLAETLAVNAVRWGVAKEPAGPAVVLDLEATVSTSYLDPAVRPDEGATETGTDDDATDLEGDDA